MAVHMLPWSAGNWDELDLSGVALASNMPRKRFFRSEVELMGFYHRGDRAPLRRSRYYLSVDRAGDPVVVKPWPREMPWLLQLGVSTRFSEAWRPWQVKDGLWFWGVA